MQIVNRYTGAVLVEVPGDSLRGANLMDLDLRCADLRRADLRDADLRVSTLECADLYAADLLGADLRGTNLCGTNLRGVSLRGATLNWNSHTLIAELLRQWAGEDVQRRMLAGLVAVSTDWGWVHVFAIPVLTAVRADALDYLVTCVREGDNAPTCVTLRILSPAEPERGGRG